MKIKKNYYKKLYEQIVQDVNLRRDYLMQLNDIGFYYHATKKMIEKKK